MLMLSAFAALQAVSSVGSLPCFQPVTTDAAIPTDAAGGLWLLPFKFNYIELKG